MKFGGLRRNLGQSTIMVKNSGGKGDAVAETEKVVFLQRPGDSVRTLYVVSEKRYISTTTHFFTLGH